MREGGQTAQGTFDHTMLMTVAMTTAMLIMIAMVAMMIMMMVVTMAMIMTMMAMMSIPPNRSVWGRMPPFEKHAHWGAPTKMKNTRPLGSICPPPPLNMQPDFGPKSLFPIYHRYFLGLLILQWCLPPNKFVWERTHTPK